MTVQLSWTHGAQFAGMYAADQHGYYADEGLAVTFLEGRPGEDRTKPVLTGAAQFGLSGPPPLIQARAAGKPVRAIAAIHSRSPFVFFTMAASGITRPQDFAGRTVQIIPTALPILHAVTARVGLSPSQYREDTHSDISALYDGSVDVASGFVTNEVVRARAAGHELVVIYPDDYGVHFYGDVLFSSDDLIARDPDLVRRFLRATLTGWTDVIEDPDSVGALVQAYAPDADPLWERSTMSASVPLIFTGERPVGWMDPQIWEQVVTMLRDEQVVTTPFDPRDLYTLKFLEEHYGGRT